MVQFGHCRVMRTKQNTLVQVRDHDHWADYPASHT